MTVTREELEHLAKLAALQLNEAELDSLGKDIDSIVGYV
ncbi:MAG: Asp-tRNA(Asn)/Glu-tRNA(Gln) amidotransferase subunit GatC [bacterium]